MMGTFSALALVWAASCVPASKTTATIHKVTALLIQPPEKSKLIDAGNLYRKKRIFKSVGAAEVPQYSTHPFRGASFLQPANPGCRTKRSTRGLFPFSPSC